MGVSFKRLKGFADISGIEAAKFSMMENTARNVFSLYCFEEMRPPLLEATDLFQRSIGTETDVVQKEMFTFQDRKGRSLTLRPEATAGVMRAAIEGGLARTGMISRLFTIGPMFRYERPQKGRMRQFHQINCECLGTDSPYADASLICMLLEFLGKLGIPNLTLKINSLGCRKCRPQYIGILREYLRSMDEDGFCEDCRKRINTNPLRVLDCKVEACRTFTADAPRLFDHNCDDCRAHMDVVMQLLQAEKIPYEIDHHLVRGLDYYMRTTFEVTSNSIGAQTAVAGGGRYDGLVAQLGGEDVPGVGFACGMERLALLLGDCVQKQPDFYMLALDGSCMPTAFRLAEMLHLAGFSGEMNYSCSGMKALMRQAAKSGAAFCLLLGPDEADSDSITIKNMSTGTQVTVHQDCLAEELRKLRAGLTQE